MTSSGISNPFVIDTDNPATVSLSGEVMMRVYPRWGIIGVADDADGFALGVYQPVPGVPLEPYTDVNVTGKSSVYIGEVSNGARGVDQEGLVNKACFLVELFT